MSKRYEKCGRSMCAVQGVDPDGVHMRSRGQTIYNWQLYADHFRLALRVLHDDVSEDMLKAGVSHHIDYETHTEYVTNKFKVMITAAIPEEI